MNIIKKMIHPFGTNCYIVADNNECLVIDPGNMPDDILKAVPEQHKVKYIILTHGHFDHILAAAEIKEQTGCEVLIHGKDAKMLANPNLSLASKYGLQQKDVKPDILLAGGDSIAVGNVVFTVLHTPGHTMGSISLLTEKTVFSGDTLFRETIGIYQRENKILMQGAIKKLLNLDDDTVVYPGHEAKTDIGHERLYNPYASFDWEWE
jgi:hydroxyacylglutathione hydrolase